MHETQGTQTNASMRGGAPRALESAAVGGDQAVQSEVLEGLAMAVNHRRWFVELALEHLGENPIEVGSGRGDYALEWAEHVPITATEADPDRLVSLKERFADHPRISVQQLLLPGSVTGSHSAAVSYNVLEHIEDHVGALASMAGLTRPGGKVVIIVPAFMWAMSPVDVATGHVRRYTTRSLTRAMEEAGLVVETMRYVNALGLVGYYLATSVLRLTPREGPMVATYDRFVLPATRYMEERVKVPFGQSVFAVARVG